MSELDPSQHELDQQEFTAQERSLAEWLDPDSRRLEGLSKAVEAPVVKLELVDSSEPEKGWTSGPGWPE